MEGLAFLDKSLFASYTYNDPSTRPRRTSISSSSSEEGDDNSPIFEINLPALLETLQIFGTTAPSTYNTRDLYNSSTSFNPRSAPFSHPTLGLPNSQCTFLYQGSGHPFSIILEEDTIRTNCDLTTYEPRVVDDIPFTRDKLATKIIMRSSYLFDAITELSSTSPSSLTLLSSAKHPYFSLSASGPLGSAQVDFSVPDSADPFSRPKANAAIPSAKGTSDAQGVLETFHPPRHTRRFTQRYKFSLVKAAARAMAVATKVSIRADEAGVLSLQFMIEVDALMGGGGSGTGGAAADGRETVEKEKGAAKVSFVEFRFVPLVREEGDDNVAGEEGEEGESTDDE